MFRMFPASVVDGVTTVSTIHVLLLSVGEKETTWSTAVVCSSRGLKIYKDGRLHVVEVLVMKHYILVHYKHNIISI